jgi:hypothetical protein
VPIAVALGRPLSLPKVRAGQTPFGQTLVKDWSDTGCFKASVTGENIKENRQILVKYWSNTGQILVKYWSNTRLPAIWPLVEYLLSLTALRMSKCDGLFPDRCSDLWPQIRFDRWSKKTGQIRSFGRREGGGG